MKPVMNDPVRPTQPPPAEVDALIALYNSRHYAELENRARSLVDRYPDFGFGWKLLGGALQMQGRNALPAFQKAAELMPGESDAHYNLGVALKSLGLLDDAAASYRRALKIKPDYAEALNNLGNVLKDLGQFNDAVASFRRALALKPGYAEAHKSLGEILQIFGQPDAALASYRRVQELRPDLLQHSIYAHLVLPIIPESPAVIAEWRERYQNGIAKLMNIPGTLELERTRCSQNIG